MLAVTLWFFTSHNRTVTIIYIGLIAQLSTRKLTISVAKQWLECL
jgi:hypothetical protein